MTRIQFTKHLRWGAPALAMAYFGATWLWKSAFIWGNGTGPYWLFIAMDRAILPVTIVSFLVTLGALAVWLTRRIRREPSARSAALTGGSLLLTTLILLGASFPALASPMTPLDSLAASGHVYHLASIGALIDNNYALFECDRVGLMCREIYRSGDHPPSEPIQAQLAYDAETNLLSIHVSAHGTIHTYRP